MRTLNTKKKKPDPGLELTGFLTFDHTTWDGQIYVHEGGCDNINIVSDNSIDYCNGTISTAGPECRDCPHCRQPMDHQLVTKPNLIQETWNGCEACGYRVKLQDEDSRSLIFHDCCRSSL